MGRDSEAAGECQGLESQGGLDFLVDHSPRLGFGNRAACGGKLHAAESDDRRGFKAEPPCLDTESQPRALPSHSETPLTRRFVLALMTLYMVWQGGAVSIILAPIHYGWRKAMRGRPAIAVLVEQSAGACVD
jgi:hypothetical protein